VPLRFFGSKSTTSRFGERFCYGQYSLVSFLFAVFLLTMPPPCPTICKSGGTCLPCPTESATLHVTAVSLILLVSSSIARRPYRNVFEAHETNNCVDATLCVLFETFSQHRRRRKFDIQCAFGTTTREKKTTDTINNPRINTFYIHKTADKKGLDWTMFTTPCF